MDDRDERSARPSDQEDPFEEAPRADPARGGSARPRTPRPGAPRRPTPRSRARAGSSVQAVGPASGGRTRQPEQPTRALPAGERAPQGPSGQQGSSPASPSRPSSRQGAPVHHHEGAGAAGAGAAVPPSGPQGPDQPGGPQRPGGPRRRSRVPRPMRLGMTLVALVLVIVLGWGAGLALWANSRIEHVDALSGAADTPGTTYLIAGSDARGGKSVADDGTQGGRADTMMLLHRAANGKSYLVSLPRDTLVDIPGHGKYKLNAAYSFGGPQLMVKTVEEFTGMTIDHYVEVGFDGVTDTVDAVGHVNLCIDKDVDDEKSGLKMAKGCHDVGGEQALAFVRARYFDPTADIGRQARQQQFVAALMDRVTSPAVLLNPFAQAKLAGAGSGALLTDDHTGLVDLGRAGLAMRRSMKDGTNLSIPIVTESYQTNNSGVAILTDETETKQFFSSVADGTATAKSGD
ncbi:LCP family protein [Brachybacterium kimchii]|uniref:LCP family protein n=1 Tax=Brachybacterium kimchii TaxID=2942909 RepID=A0ABY4N678_9MICO|nr:LCP family protein [Brachybacterium kimchii]UQN30058.1 LCP family protein [Brachybacterium kimchii]